MCSNIVCALCTVVLFFVKQKTAYEMRISDWSSDVCSSDLRLQLGRLVEVGQGLGQAAQLVVGETAILIGGKVALIALDGCRVIHDRSRILAVAGMGEAAAVQRPGSPRLQRHRAFEVGEPGVAQLIFGLNLAGVAQGSVSRENSRVGRVVIKAVSS